MKKLIYIVFFITAFCQGQIINSYAYTVYSSSLDYTNFLEDATDIDADFDFYDNAGTIQSGISARNTSGEWCLETTGSTTSGGTGATANPTDRSAYIYFEASSADTSTVRYFQRNITLDNSNQDLKVDIIHNLNIDITFDYYFEYSAVASPNQTTDWTVLETVSGTATDSWIAKTFDLSTATASSALWVRIRYDSFTFEGDLCFSTWREYK